MRTWIYQDPSGTYEITDEEIKRTFYPQWRARMRKKNSSFSESVLTLENCIKDFVTVHYAWEKRANASEGSESK